MDVSGRRINYDHGTLTELYSLGKTEALGGKSLSKQ